METRPLTTNATGPERRIALERVGMAYHAPPSRERCLSQASFAPGTGRLGMPAKPAPPSKGRPAGHGRAVVAECKMLVLVLHTTVNFLDETQAASFQRQRPRSQCDGSHWNGWAWQAMHHPPHRVACVEQALLTGTRQAWHICHACAPARKRGPRRRIAPERVLWQAIDNPPSKTI